MRVGERAVAWRPSWSRGVVTNRRGWRRLHQPLVIRSEALVIYDRCAELREGTRLGQRSPVPSDGCKRHPVLSAVCDGGGVVASTLWPRCPYSINPSRCYTQRRPCVDLRHITLDDGNVLKLATSLTLRAAMLAPHRLSSFAVRRLLPILLDASCSCCSPACVGGAVATTLSANVGVRRPVLSVSAGLGHAAQLVSGRRPVVVVVAPLTPDQRAATAVARTGKAFHAGPAGPHRVPDRRSASRRVVLSLVAGEPDAPRGARTVACAIVSARCSMNDDRVRRVSGRRISQGAARDRREGLRHHTVPGRPPCFGEVSTYASSTTLITAIRFAISQTKPVTACCLILGVRLVLWPRLLLAQARDRLLSIRCT